MEIFQNYPESVRHYDEIGLVKPVKGQYPDTEHVIFRTLPEVTVASATCHGSCEHMSELYAAVTQWIVDNGYELDGPMFNISRMNIIKVITCILNIRHKKIEKSLCV